MRTPRETVAAFVERLWNGRDLDAAEELFAPDCVTHQLRSGAETPSAVRGPDAIRRHVADWLRAFPDLRVTLREQVAEGNRVASRCIFEGTHRDTFLGAPGSGRRVSIEMMVIHRIAEGRIVEDWVLVEAYGLFEQLGMVAPREALVRGGHR